MSESRQGTAAAKEAQKKSEAKKPAKSAKDATTSKSTGTTKAAKNAKAENKGGATQKKTSAKKSAAHKSSASKSSAKTTAAKSESAVKSSPKKSAASKTSAAKKSSAKKNSASKPKQNAAAKKSAPEKKSTTAVTPRAEEKAFAPAAPVREAGTVEIVDVASEGGGVEIDRATLMNSVAALGLPAPGSVELPAHRRRSKDFAEYAAAVARGAVDCPPELMSGRQRRLHVRDTVIEDHVVRMHLVPAAVESKFADLARDPFSFFRGTALLYYRDIAGTDAFLPFVPTVGDIHPENFGVLPGADGRPLFAVNDMDEAWIAPFTWDLERGAVGFALAAIAQGLSENKALKVAEKFVDSYFRGIRACIEDPGEKLRRISGHGPGVIEPYMKKAHRTRASFLRKRIDAETLTFLETERVHRVPRMAALVEEPLREYASRVANPAIGGLPENFFDILDVAIRTGSGTASRGLTRFWVLVAGWGDGPEEKVIIELKLSRHSVLDGLAPAREDDPGREAGRKKDGYAGEKAEATDQLDPAERVSRAFHAFIIDGDPFYGHTSIEGMSFLVRERSPQKVNVDVEDFDYSGLKKYAKLCGRVLARQHVRADAELNGSSSDVAERIDSAGSARVFKHDAREFVEEKLQQVLYDFDLFASDHANGAFEVRTAQS